MIRVMLGAGLIAMAGLAPLPAHAQMSEIAGQWSCETAYAEYNGEGYIRGHTNAFSAFLYANGSLDAVGSTMSAAGVTAFQGSGAWQYLPQTHEVSAQAVIVSQYGIQNALPFGGTLSPDLRVFQSTIEVPDTTETYILQRLAVLCRR